MGFKTILLLVCEINETLTVFSICIRVLVLAGAKVG